MNSIAHQNSELSGQTNLIRANPEIYHPEKGIEEHNDDSFKSTPSYQFTLTDRIAKQSLNSHRDQRKFRETVTSQKYISPSRKLK